jgi:3-dehydroquinate synthetase
LNNALTPATMDADGSKPSGGRVKFVLATRLGKVLHGREVPEALLQRALDQLA